VSNAVTNYRSLWVPKLDTLWAAKVRLADAAVDELEALLRLAWEGSWFNGPAPSYDDWLADLRDTLNSKN